MFVCCGSCNDCSDAELETKIVAQITCIRPETSVARHPGDSGSTGCGGTQGGYR